MRVALVCPYSLDVPGGVATHVLGLARWLRDHGHDPVVVAPGERPVQAGVPVRLLGRATPLRFNGSTARLALAPAQARAARAAVSGADLVHVHEPLTPGAGFAAARAAGRLIVTHHAAFTVGPWWPALRARSALLPPRVSLAVSTVAAQTARIATGAAIDVVPNAIELPPPAVARSGRPVVAFLGRDEPRKGLGVFARLAGAGLDADFVAAGPGVGTGDIPGVRVLGVLNDEDRSRLLSNATVLVAPNLTGESFGMVLVEALAHGAGVLASDLPAFRAVADDPACIAFFPPGDAAAAATALASLLRIPPDPARACAAASRFGWDRVGPRVLDAYARAMSGDGIG